MLVKAKGSKGGVDALEVSSLGGVEVLNSDFTFIFVGVNGSVFASDFIL